MWDIASTMAGAATMAAPAAATGAVLMRARLRRAAAIDPLTKVFTRDGLARLGKQMRGDVRRGHQVAVLVLDLRGFKALNDAYGHDVGDTVLAVVAGRLAGIGLTHGRVVRLGGDEFAALATTTGGPRWPGLIGAVRSYLGDRIDLAEGVTVRPEATIGAAIATKTDTLPGLLKAADTAMYAARREGKPFRIVAGGLAVADRPRDRVRDAARTDASTSVGVAA